MGQAGDARPATAVHGTMDVGLTAAPMIVAARKVTCCAGRRDAILAKLGSVHAWSLARIASIGGGISRQADTRTAEASPSCSSRLTARPRIR